MTDLERKAVKRVFELLEIAQGDLRDATEILRQALAQQEQEPVAWHEPDSFGNVTTYKKWALENGWQPLYTKPPSIEAAVLAEREACAGWLRDNYQDYKNIADICEAIRTRGEK